MPDLGSGHHWADYSFTLTASVSLLMSEAKGAHLAFRHSASLWSCTVNDICPESVLYNQEKKKKDLFGAGNIHGNELFGLMPWNF